MTLSPSINPGRPPLGGKWQFVVDGLTIADESFPELVKRVRSHLISRLLTIPEVEQMILEQERRRCPWLVSEIEGEIKIPKHQKIFRNFVHRLGSLEYLDFDDAEKRREVCRGCPMNSAMEVDDEARRTLYLLSRGKQFPDLGICIAYAFPLAVACMTDLKVVCRQPMAPEFCWVKP